MAAKVAPRAGLVVGPVAGAQWLWLLVQRGQLLWLVAGPGRLGPALAHLTYPLVSIPCHVHLAFLGGGGGFPPGLCIWMSMRSRAAAADPPTPTPTPTISPFLPQVPSWFVRVEEIKERLLANNAVTHWVPSYVKDKRFHNWLENARDWVGLGLYLLGFWAVDVS